MKIILVSPGYGKGPVRGNTVTSRRWARILRGLGNQVRVTGEYSGENCDALIALHAQRSCKSVREFRRRYPELPVIMALTGTDLYRDFPGARSVSLSLQAADLVLALQPKTLDAIPDAFRAKARFIYQSAAASKHRLPVKENARAALDSFDVCVVGNLRAVKDPFRTAMAVRNLPSFSHIRVIHLGAALSDADEKRALAEMKRNPRYTWLGPQAPATVRKILRRSAACVLSSRAEGGANVISEAIAEGVPVLASRIPGSVGILGEDYPGYFSAGDTEGLRKLLIRAEGDQDFRRMLRSHCRRLASLVDPAREIAAWKNLLAELSAIS